jgi:hypothetical protein
MRGFFVDFGVVLAPLPAADLYDADGEFVLEVEVVRGQARADLPNA